MLLFKMPCKVTNVIEKLQRDSLWEGNGVKKDHLVKWSEVDWPKDQGGLGIDRVKERNTSLLGKWL